jgi:hypothetical protein
MNISVANAIAIKTATHTIAVLWHDATLIADKLANPHHNPTGGSHTTRTTPPAPINLHATSVLDDMPEHKEES